MKYLIGVDIGEYVFTPILSKVEITGIDFITLDQVLLITNVSTNQVIYQFNKPGFGATINSNVLTLDYVTSEMSQDDTLQIFIDYKASALSTGLPVGAANFISQYTQTDLLQLIYEELQAQTKLLKKIYQ